MKWTIRIEFTPDGNEPGDQEIGTISRPIADLRPEQVGLTLEEGRQLIRCIESTMIANQVHAYTLACKPCSICGQRQHFKDIRTKCLQTVFGAYRFRGRRLRTCTCPCRILRGRPTSFFPTGEIIPRRTTPEVRYLFAELGARMPYREASQVLNICGFKGMRSSRTTIRRLSASLINVTAVL